MMKAITIWQPWASLLASGKKKYETRGWPTSYRGPIAIHAAKRQVRKTVDDLASDRNGSGWNALDRLESLFVRPGALDQLPIGAIVGTAVLTRCNRITEEFVAGLSPQEIDLGDYTIGRWAWEFENVKELQTPIPVSGKQGLWNWEEGEVVAPPDWLSCPGGCIRSYARPWEHCDSCSLKEAHS